MKTKAIITLLICSMIFNGTVWYKNYTLNQNSLSQNIKISDLNQSLYNSYNDLMSKEEQLTKFKQQKYELKYLGNFEVTYYCNEPYEHICGYGDGLTALGTKTIVGQTVAVDKTVIPLGATVYIDGYGFRTAEDVGGAIKGNRIDILVDTHKEALDLGRTHNDVWILVERY